MIWILLCPNILSADCFDEYAIGVRYGSGVGMVGYRSSGGIFNLNFMPELCLSICSGL